MSPEDEALLLLYCEKQLQDICRTENATSLSKHKEPSRFTNRVLLSAQIYFKRFFLVVSPMEVAPYDMKLAAIYLAGKVEEERIQVSDLVPEYSKNLLPEGLLSLEMRLLEALAFQVITRSPFRCLSGLMQDLYDATARGAPQSAAAATESLDRLHRASTDRICRALCTDAPFLYPPQQIALAALLAAHRAADRAEAAADEVNVGAWVEQRIAPGMATPDGSVERPTAPLLERLSRIELGEPTFLGKPVDLNSEGIKKRVIRLDKQLRRLAKALHSGEEERRQRAEEEQRRRKRALDERD